MNELVRNSSWARAVRLGMQPSGAELRAHLLAVHEANAGFTEACAMRCRNGEGRNTYEWLVAVIEPHRHREVLDLACGSGHLLALCREQFGDRVRLSGIDMSADELAIARRRDRFDAVMLHHGLAQDLKFFPGKSVDAILCHWALTLMDPVAPVLAEANRLLARGGVFAAIVDGDIDREPHYRAIHDLIYRAVQHELPQYGTLDLGDPRVRSTDELETLVRAAFPHCKVTIEPGAFALDGTPAKLAREAAGFFYASFVLSPPAHRAMLDEIEAFLAAEPASGRFTMPVNRLTVTRA